MRNSMHASWAARDYQLCSSRVIRLRFRGGRRQFRKEQRHFTGSVAVHDTLTPEEAAEERRLWADYYEAVARILEIMRSEGTAEGAVSRIVAEDSTASRAIARIKQLHGIPDSATAQARRSPIQLEP
jgi:hypothetical protein